jgi:hypothetical protein
MPKIMKHALELAPEFTSTLRLPMYIKMQEG